MNKVILKKLALERCHAHVSHLCTLMYMGNQDEKGIDESLYGVFESLNKELCLIEALMDDV